MITQDFLSLFLCSVKRCLWFSYVYIFVYMTIVLDVDGNTTLIVKTVLDKCICFLTYKICANF